MIISETIFEELKVECAFEQDEVHWKRENWNSIDPKFLVSVTTFKATERKTYHLELLDSLKTGLINEKITKNLNKDRTKLHNQKVKIKRLENKDRREREKAKKMIIGDYFLNAFKNWDRIASVTTLQGIKNSLENQTDSELIDEVLSEYN